MKIFHINYFNPQILRLILFTLININFSPFITVYYKGLEKMGAQMSDLRPFCS